MIFISVKQLEWKRHLDWLHTCKLESRISNGIYTVSVKVSEEIDKATDAKMPIPAACTGPDGEMFYAWNNKEHHLELEIFPGKKAEWFYRNRATDEHWGEDQVATNEFPPKVLETMKLFYEDKDEDH